MSEEAGTARTSAAPAPIPERQLSLEVDGGQITGWLSGTGPPLLLLHGGPGFSEYLASLAAELAPAFTVFRYQQRGLPPSVTDGDRSVDGHVADAARVLDGLGWERAIIAGHSWGGHLAMHVVVAHPKRARALAPIGALWAVGDGGMAVFGQTLLGRLPAPERAQVDEIYAREDAEDAPPIGEPEDMPILWPYYFADPPHAPPIWPLLSDRVGSREAMASITDHFERQTLEKGLAGLSVPTILIHGERDPIPAAEAERTALLIPGAELHILPRTGHYLWLEDPGAVRGLLAAFVERIPA